MNALFSKPKMPTHLDIAATSLENARIALLEAESTAEAAECTVMILKARVERLTEYVEGKSALAVGPHLVRKV